MAAISTFHSLDHGVAPVGLTRHEIEFDDFYTMTAWIDRGYIYERAGQQYLYAETMRTLSGYRKMGYDKGAGTRYQVMPKTHVLISSAQTTETPPWPTAVFVRVIGDPMSSNSRVQKIAVYDPSLRFSHDPNANQVSYIVTSTSSSVVTIPRPPINERLKDYLPFYQILARAQLGRWLEEREIGGFNSPIRAIILDYAHTSGVFEEEALDYGLLSTTGAKGVSARALQCFSPLFKEAGKKVGDGKIDDNETVEAAYQQERAFVDAFKSLPPVVSVAQPSLSLRTKMIRTKEDDVCALECEITASNPGSPHSRIMIFDILDASMSGSNLLHPRTGAPIPHTGFNYRVRQIIADNLAKLSDTSIYSLISFEKENGIAITPERVTPDNRNKWIDLLRRDDIASPLVPDSAHDGTEMLNPIAHAFEMAAALSVLAREQGQPCQIWFRLWTDGKNDIPMRLATLDRLYRAFAALPGEAASHSHFTCFGSGLSFSTEHQLRNILTPFGSRGRLFNIGRDPSISSSNVAEMLERARPRTTPLFKDVMVVFKGSDVSLTGASVKSVNLGERLLVKLPDFTTESGPASFILRGVTAGGAENSADIQVELQSRSAFAKGNDSFLSSKSTISIKDTAVDQSTTQDLTLMSQYMDTLQRIQKAIRLRDTSALKTEKEGLQNLLSTLPPTRLPLIVHVLKLLDMIDSTLRSNVFTSLEEFLENDHDYGRGIRSGDETAILEVLNHLNRNGQLRILHRDQVRESFRTRFTHDFFIRASSETGCLVVCWLEPVSQSEVDAALMARSDYLEHEGKSFKIREELFAVFAGEKEPLFYINNENPSSHHVAGLSCRGTNFWLSYIIPLMMERRRLPRLAQPLSKEVQHQQELLGNRRLYVRMLGTLSRVSRARRRIIGNVSTYLNRRVVSCNHFLRTQIANLAQLTRSAFQRFVLNPLSTAAHSIVRRVVNTGHLLLVRPARFLEKQIVSLSQSVTGNIRHLLGSLRNLVTKVTTPIWQGVNRLNRNVFVPSMDWCGHQIARFGNGISQGVARVGATTTQIANVFIRGMNGLNNRLVNPITQWSIRQVRSVSDAIANKGDAIAKLVTRIANTVANRVIVPIANWAGRSLHAIGSGMYRAVASVGNSGIRMVNAIWKAVSTSFNSLINSVVNPVNQWGRRQLSKLSNVLEQGELAIVKSAVSIKNAIANRIVVPITRWVGRSLHAMGSGMYRAVASVCNLGIRMVNAIWKTVSTSFNSLINSVVNPVNQWGRRQLSKLSNVLEQGRLAVAKLLNKILNAVTNRIAVPIATWIEKTLYPIGPGMYRATASVFNRTVTAMGNIWQKMSGGIRSAVMPVIRRISSSIQRVSAPIASRMQRAFNTAQDYIIVRFAAVPQEGVARR